MTKRLILSDDEYNKVTAARAKERSPVPNIYLVTDDHVFCLVVAHGSEEALEYIQEQVGLNWGLKNTTTRRVQRNVSNIPFGVIEAGTLGQETKKPFRLHVRREGSLEKGD